MEIVELVVILIVSLVALVYRREAVHYRKKCSDISTQYAKQEVELRMLRRRLGEARGSVINE